MASEWHKSYYEDVRYLKHATRLLQEDAGEQVDDNHLDEDEG